MATVGTALGTVAMAALLILAGCTGTIGGTPSSAPESTDVRSPANAAAGASAGTIEFYLSDRPSDIDDFSRLNVTVTRIGLHRTGPANGSDDGDGGWIEYDADATVDLTELRGSNATNLGELEAPDGSYDRVFVYVGDVEATLANGEDATVKLPSGKLRVKKGFTVDDGDRIRFVFDVGVHRAGKSGKYVLEPVVAESGTGVPIEDVDSEERTDGTLDLRLLGDVSPGGNATVEVTRRGDPVANATVRIDDEVAGTTDAAGRFTCAVPATAEELEIEVEKAEAEAELDREFEDE